VQGIGADSSIEKAIYIHGQPIEMYVTRGDGEESAYLNYLHQGIAFKFIDGALKSIGVMKPTSEGDLEYPDDIGDIGDTSKYRAISVGK
ncbi:MAG: hypothetical protein GXP28_11405, partial [Planctomycetes bacterium]|nr:hypothetical protein [Planctomycetota bacterium]